MPRVVVAPTNTGVQLYMHKYVFVRTGRLLVDTRSARQHLAYAQLAEAHAGAKKKAQDSRGHAHDDEQPPPDAQFATR